MKRFSPGVAAPALLVIVAPFLGCIPNPDISGLPPYDGGGAAPDSAVTPISDASVDVTLSQDGGSDTGPTDSAPPLGTVSGIVIDYTQGNGKGVVPGAVVSVTPPGSATTLSATTDANGLFTIPNVPAGVSLQIEATKPTDLVKGIAYSSTYVVTTVGAGQTVNIFPVLHEGCFQTFVLNPGAGTDAGNAPVTLLDSTCPGGSPRTGAYAAMSFDSTSFEDSSQILWTQNSGTIRVEMIPLAYPVNAGVPDLSWSAGLPGAVSPAGLLGAAEYRVWGVSPSNPDVILRVHDPVNHPVGIAVPVYAAPRSAQVVAYSYSSSAGAGGTPGWTSESTVPGSLQDAGAPLQYVTIQVPHLGWWAATNGVTPTTCVTGTLQAGGSPLPNVVVRGGGVNYLGASTGQTNAAGLFCLDVTAATADGGAAQIGLVASALSGGVPYTATQTFQVTSTTGGGSCSLPSSCTSLPAINLSPTLTCVSGSVVALDGGAPTMLNATLVTLPVTAAQSNAGIQSSAYVGQVAVGAGGSFCALAPPGSQLQLRDPASPNCWAPSGTELAVLNGSSAPLCSAGGCADAGTISFGCSAGP